MDVTAILLNYQRPKEMTALLESLKSQSVPVKIILANNAKIPFPQPSLADQYLHIPWNAGCFIRLFLAHYVTTEYILFIDDDKLPKDIHFVRDALIVAREHPGVLTGAMGKILSTEPPHHYHRDAFGLVHVMKGFTGIFERRLLHKVPITPPFQEDKAFMDRCDDIHLSMMLGAGLQVHWADRGIYDRLENLDLYGVGYSHEPHHNEIRDAIAKKYLNLFGAGIP